MKLLPDNSNLKEVLEDSRLYALKEGGSRADMATADLRRVVELRGADLRDASLCGADLREADLSGVNLRGASLRDANLIEANLSGANLSKANLSGANLRWANLTGAKFNWQSHALLGEVLRQEAGENIARQMLAAWVKDAIHFCWLDFLKVRHKEKHWALTTLAKYIQPDDEHPKILDKYIKEA